MRRDLTPDDLADFLELPLVAVLATYRADGSVLLSPVWHEWRDGGFSVATTRDDVKVRHFSRDPRASLVVAESDPPYRGLEVRGEPRILEEPSGDTGARLAVRYLGEERGRRYARKLADNTVIRFEPRGPDDLRAWDFADEL